MSDEFDEDTTNHTSTRMTGRMTVIARVSGRRLWTVDQKLLMLRDAFGSGGAVHTAMERHEVSSGQLYTWRKQAMSGELSGFSAPALPPPLPGVNRQRRLHWRSNKLLVVPTEFPAAVSLPDALEHTRGRVGGWRKLAAIAQGSRCRRPPQGLCDRAGILAIGKQVLGQSHPERMRAQGFDGCNQKCARKID